MRLQKYFLKFGLLLLIFMILQSCGSRKIGGQGRLSFITYNREYILLVENENGELEPFPREEITEYSWSPDGKKLVFESYGNPDLMDIFIINADGSGETNLTNNSGIQDMSPIWSPNGKKILFTSDRTGSVEIYVINIDGTNLIQLTDNIGEIGFPNWSPNGKYIIFSAGEGGYYFDGKNNIFDSSLYIHLGIFRVASDGSELVKIINEGIYPKYSPDGKYIIYQSTKNDQGGIYRMRLDGSEIIQLSDEGHNPSWSPDGMKIAYVKIIDNNNNEIFVMNYDGTNQTNLTNSPNRDLDPVWSLDGKKIAFTTRREDYPSCIVMDKPYYSEISIMNANGTEQTIISNMCDYSGHPNWRP
jgi:Tol biopolymer transport system component